jgi:hypothetical protein
MLAVCDAFPRRPCQDLSRSLPVRLLLTVRRGDHIRRQGGRADQEEEQKHESQTDDSYREAPAVPEAVKPLSKLTREHVGFTAVDFHLAEILLGVLGFITQRVGRRGNGGEIDHECAAKARQQNSNGNKPASSLYKSCGRSQLLQDV